jgi:hypothetical protein
MNEKSFSEHELARVNLRESLLNMPEDKRVAIEKKRQELQNLIDTLDWENFIELYTTSDEFRRGHVALIKHMEWFKKENFATRTLHQRLKDAHIEAMMFTRQQAEIDALYNKWKITDKQLRNLNQELEKDETM